MPALKRPCPAVVRFKAVLSPYDPAWASEFAELQAVYVSALSGLALRIEHVGSTAVPGLPAKPVLDIDIVIQSYSVFHEIINALELLGYQHCGDQGIPQREVFKPKGVIAPFVASRTFMRHHLYVCPESSPELRRHIRFRDMLRARPDLRREYETIKLGIAHRAGGDRRRYAEIKEIECREFVERVLGQAEQPHAKPQ
ncbi:MAG TPA: GrpB family protein [Gammaproteobacteria bacterium]